ncbi:MAG: glycosyltransferase, partial [Phascolarctobacterium sp.]|nr:glycosyltransferase [Phascolarctobacterium sp.]
MTCESEFEGINLKTVSIVVPVYNEEDNLREFHKRITEVMSQEPYDYKIVFVNDGSSDGSAVVLNELAKEDDHVEAFLLSRNYGHQMA